MTMNLTTAAATTTMFVSFGEQARTVTMTMPMHVTVTIAKAVVKIRLLSLVEHIPF
jgi:hypothetical protein